MDDKIKITLNDYDYQRDIEHRLLMQELTDHELIVLQEIIDGPLKTTLMQLKKNLDLTTDQITTALEKFEKSGLISQDNKQLTVNKELRKYYESQMVKFEDGFEPGIEFLQPLLSKVPIHSLPTWYSLNQKSGTIFSHIVENYLSSTKIYEKHLASLKLDPIQKAIMEEVFASPGFKVSASTIMKKLALTQHQFEEHMLFLEFSFICCLGYEKEGESWKSIVTPFREWQNFNQYIRNSSPQTIKETNAVVPNFYNGRFINNLNQLLRLAQIQKMVVVNGKISDADREKINGGSTRDEEEANLWNRLWEIVLKFPLAEIKAGQLNILKSGVEWLNSDPVLQIGEIYRYLMINKPLEGSYMERDSWEVVRSLRRVMKLGWVYYDDFMKGLLVPLGNREECVLKKNGKKWEYALPEYNEEDKAFVFSLIFILLRDAGIVMTGKVKNRDCFFVTPEGKQIIG